MIEFRCKDCGKLLAMIKEGAEVEIKCPRCSTIQCSKPKIKQKTEHLLSAN